MQLPYIDDRRLLLFGKVTSQPEAKSQWEAMEAVTCSAFQSTFVFLPPQAFGGYLTLKMLAATDQLFQCAAAAAPITDFRLYSKYRL